MVRGPRGSVVEHFLGKEGVTGSIPVVGSILSFLGGESEAVKNLMISRA